MHAHHEGLPGYSEAQLLHDGCLECEQRAATRNLGLAYLDKFNFARAWARAAESHRRGLPDIAVAELPMLEALWAVQVQLEQHGVRIGVLPTN